MIYKNDERMRDFFCFYCSLVFYILGAFLIKIIPLAFVGYEMIIANSALHASLAIYHLISNARSWNNRPFAGSGHMVRNKLHWDANDAVGLSKQRKVGLDW